MPAPNDAKAMQRLLGLVNYLAKIMLNLNGSGRGLEVMVLDSGLYGRGFDPHTGRGSLLRLKQFH